MRFISLLGILFAGWNAAAETPASRLWLELKAKRDNLPSVYQEFEVSRTFKTARDTQAAQWKIVLDMSHGQWREKSIRGSGNRIRIFDGSDLFVMEGDSEYLRPKRSPKEDRPAPSAYTSSDVEWTKAVELERRPCAIPGVEHTCVLLEMPMKRWARPSSSGRLTTLLGGTKRLVLDTETGLLLTSRAVFTIDNQRGGYQTDVLYVAKRLSSSGAADVSLFQQPPADMKEVKELSRWNAARMKKQLIGKPAPELEVNDLQGEPLALTAFKGKTVLLDFWASWCPPCRADGPALDKLYKKYGQQELMILGISVSEDRAIVEKYLGEHPHAFPVVLTTENEMPRPYQIGIFPTYIVIDKDGNVTAAVEGDKSFGELRGLLKKAGLELE
ncbi:MAG: TlpA family protein disulfide reductase [Acidobacteriota bacterium]|nr:TlpA family protein disulfide reductase [Acidobacteriota bacterium]